MKKPNICLLFCGGTIGMVKNSETGALQPASSALDIIKKFPEIEEVVDLDFEIVVNIDSSNMSPIHWTKIAEKIHSIYDKYDGFVVVQGTDTMAYSASALSFALQNIGKPIVFTGSLIPLSNLGSDGHSNLIYACMSATLDIAEVCLVFSNKIIRGNRSKKYHESMTAVFKSPNHPDLGELGRPFKLNSWRTKRSNRTPKFQPHFDPSISLLKLFPGFDPVVIDHVVKQGTHGIILEGFGPGNLPFLENSVIPSVENAMKSGVPVVVANQMERGVTNLTAYEAGYYADQAGAISSKDMTTESTVTKLMWTLAQTHELSKIKEIMETSLAGELSI